MGIIITNNPVGTGHALSVNENWNRGYVSCQELTPIANRHIVKSVKLYVSCQELTPIDIASIDVPVCEFVETM